MSKHRGLIVFAIIGIINTVVDVGIFLTLRHLSITILLANIISTSVALTVSYTLNKKFTFKSDARRAKSLVLFLIVTLIGLWILQPIVIKLVLAILHTQTISGFANHIISRPDRLYELFAKLCATPVTLVWNYLLYKHVVFKT